MKRIIHILSVFLFAAAAQSQQLTPEQKADATETSKVATADTSLTSDVQDKGPSFVFQATESETSIAGRIGYSIGESLDIGLQLKSPFDQGNPREVTLADLSGLAGETVGTLSASYRMVHFIKDYSTVKGASLLKVCDAYNETADSAEELANDGCRYLALKKKGPEWEIRALRSLPVALTYITASYSLSNPTFDFIDPNSLEEDEISVTNRSMGISVGHLRKGIFYSIGYKRRLTHRAGQEVELCQPIGIEGALVCTDVVLGAPVESEQDVASFDIKSLMSPRLALNLRLLYDFKEDLFNPHLFVFFLQQENGVLNGGFDLSYDDEDEFSARVFIGTKFNLFP